MSPEEVAEMMSRYRKVFADRGFPVNLRDAFLIEILRHPEFYFDKNTAILSDKTTPIESAKNSLNKGKE